MLGGWGGGGFAPNIYYLFLSYIQDDIAKSIIIIINMKIFKQQISKKVWISHTYKIFAKTPQKLNHVHTLKIGPTVETMNKCSKTEYSVFGRSTNSAEPSTAKENPECQFCLLTRCYLPVAAVSAFVKRKKKDCFIISFKIILKSFFSIDMQYHLPLDIFSHAT